MEPISDHRRDVPDTAYFAMTAVTIDLEPHVIQLADHYQIEFDVYINSDQFGRYRSATLTPNNKFLLHEQAENYGKRVVEYFTANNNVFPNFNDPEWK